MTTETGPDSEVKNVQEEAPQQQLAAATHGPTATAAGTASRDAEANEKPGAQPDSRNTEPVSLARGRSCSPGGTGGKDWLWVTVREGSFNFQLFPIAPGVRTERGTQHTQPTNCCLQGGGSTSCYMPDPLFVSAVFCCAVALQPLVLPWRSGMLPAAGQRPVQALHSHFLKWQFVSQALQPGHAHEKPVHVSR